MLSVEVQNVRRHETARAGTPSNLLAVASVLFGGELVVHGVKLIRPPGPPAALQTAFPAHTSWVYCAGCHARGEERDNFCRNCGVQLRPTPCGERRHFDEVHPISHALRDRVTAAFVRAWEALQTQRTVILASRSGPPAPTAEEFGAGLG